MAKKQKKKNNIVLREPAIHYVSQEKIFTAPFGEILPLNNSVAPQLHYSHKNGKLFLGNSIEWLTSLDDHSVDLVFADPPYNIKKAEWDTFKNQEEYIAWSLTWIEQAVRVLKKNGTLYVCGFTEILADLKHPAMKLFESCRWIIWHYKNKANLGSDWGRSHESIVHFRKGKNFVFNIDDVRIPYGNHTLKYPSHPQAKTSQYNNGKDGHLWEPNPKGAKPKDVIELPTTCNGSGETTPHPTQKPEELLRKILMVSSNDGDIVLDPFSGSGTTLVVAEQLNRKWLGCDNSKVYNEWAIQRIENVIRRTKEQWIEFDRQTAARRESIR
jgi:site-specific DNA-methyltransferase (adenine-specific)